MYVRTKKNQIYRVDDVFRDYRNKKLYRVASGLCFMILDEEEVVKEAETIEELCDEFVDIDNHDYYKIAHKNGITFALSKTKRFIGHCDIRLEYIGQIMGAIYTDKGLQFVARMNSKGELELL